MKYIMPGASRWFQVHGQQPFGTLKKKMTLRKFYLWTSTETEPEDFRDILKYLFYEAEANAFDTQVLQKTFADVGLWPWNPDRMMKNCQENCPVVPPLNESRLVKKLLNIIVDIDKEEQLGMQQMLSEMKEEQVVFQEEAVAKTVFEQQLAKNLFGWKKKKNALRGGKTINMSRKKPVNPALYPKSGRGRPRKNIQVNSGDAKKKMIFHSNSILNL